MAINLQKLFAYEWLNGKFSRTVKYPNLMAAVFRGNRQVRSWENDPPAETSEEWQLPLGELRLQVLRQETSK